MYGRKIYIGIVVAALALAGWVRASDEVFVPSGATAGTLEMRPEATVFGPEVRLRQVCRWAGGDDRQFAAVADLVVTRVEAAGTTIDLGSLRGMLRDAGLNLASVRFAGPLRCKVTRADGGGERREEAKPVVVKLEGARQPATRVAVVPDGPAVSLKERLTRDLAERLQLPIESLQISFNPSDEKVLNLSEPQFTFLIEPRKVRGLGSVGWEVTATADGAPPQKALIGATARAWQDQLVANRPISGRQVIRAEDVVERRTLVESLPDSPLLRREQVVGQQAAMDMKPGVVMVSRLVQAVPYARPGQLVMVKVQMGAVQVTTVGKAVDEGTYGQTIRVRNEGTKEVYEVTLTGPQEGTLGGRSNG